VTATARGPGPLRAGVVGLGIGRQHIRAYLDAPDCDVTAICDIDEAALAAAAEEFGVPSTFTDAQALFDSGLIDVVSIAVPNAFHAPLTIAALEAGLHVLCEKPMALSTADARTMVAAAEAADRQLGVHFSQRWRPGIYRIQRAVAAGRLGEVYYARAMWHRQQGIPARPTFVDRLRAGGGALIDNGVHLLDWTLFILGYPEPLTASAQLQSRFGDRDVEGGIEVEDFATGFVRFEGGITLSLEVSWASQHTHSEETLIQYYGTDGGALRRTYDYGEAELVIADRDGNDLALPEEPLPAATVQADLLEAIRDGREPGASSAAGLATIRILDALYASARAGHEVAVD
jgi:predicted dehydrogenase